MKRSLFARLRSNGMLYLVSALILVLGVPLYQSLILAPTGFGNALNEAGAGHSASYLAWIGGHSLLFIIYRALLIIAFVLLLSLPFSLFRIIVAQEILGQQERAEEEDAKGEEEITGEVEPAVQQGEELANSGGMPAYAWRGKGFVVLAAWIALAGLVLYTLGLIASTLYLVTAASSTNAGSLISTFTIITNTIGTGLLALGILLFGAMITRTGLRLWPGTWVAFGYVALLTGGLLFISAIGIISAPGTGQNTLTSIATLLFALWTLWLGIMLTRLKAEA